MFSIHYKPLRLM